MLAVSEYNVRASFNVGPLFWLHWFMRIFSDNDIVCYTYKHYNELFVYTTFGDSNTWVAAYSQITIYMRT